MTENKFLIAVSTFTYFGPARTSILLSYFKSAENIWNAKRNDLLLIGLKENIVDSFLEYRNKFDIDKYFEKLKSLSVKVVTKFDKNYPSNLKCLPDAPYVLYVRGNLISGDTNAIAIIGSRLMTGYGKEVARMFAIELSNYGITVVSGLALGVDAEAQRAALEASGRTISVLASGLDIITPLTNKSLALEFIKKQGAVVSEYPLGHVPFRSDFAVRNRLISGLSKGVIVIEARAKSGTFYTVKAALDQGKPVFAVPGQITSPGSMGTNYLIQNGAKLITNVKDVLDELDLELKVDHEAVERSMPGDSFEINILKVLEREPLYLDELVRITSSETSEISARLTIMEMKGLVKNLGEIGRAHV